jgi:hypothetical protein
MTFRLTMETGNSAFEADSGTSTEARRAEIARILREVAAYLEKPATLPEKTGALFDYNGNHVGSWSDRGR